MRAATERIPGGSFGRTLALTLLVGAILFVASELLSPFNNLRLANGAYYFAVLAGLTVLTGLSGQISLGHGALMAVGAYTVALLIGNEQWALVPALVAATGVTAVVGLLLGAAATRLRGPYLAGATLAFAVGLPALADKYSGTFGGENGLTINPPTPPSGLGASFPLERWEAWIACIGALVVLFVMRNVVRSGLGRTMRAVRDDEIAASLCGMHVGRVQTFAFVLSAACAGLAGGLLTIVLQLASPGAFQVSLSLSLPAAATVPRLTTSSFTSTARWCRGGSRVRWKSVCSHPVRSISRSTAPAFSRPAIDWSPKAWRRSRCASCIPTSTRPMNVSPAK